MDQHSNFNTKKEHAVSEAGKAGNKENLLALSYQDALDAVGREEPAVVEAITEYVFAYSEKVGDLLKRGSDYLDLLTPLPTTPALERIAMELVLEAVEDELDSED